MGNMCDADNSPTRISSLDKLKSSPTLEGSPTSSPKRRKVNRDDFLNLGLIGKVFIFFEIGSIWFSI